MSWGYIRIVEFEIYRLTFYVSILLGWRLELSSCIIVSVHPTKDLSLGLLRPMNKLSDFINFHITRLKALPSIHESFKQRNVQKWIAVSQGKFVVSELSQYGGSMLSCLP